MSLVDDTPASAWRTWARRFAVWSVPALFSALETYSFSRSLPQAPALWRVCAAQMPAWYVWLPLTPVLARLAVRHRLSPLRARAVLTHLGACLGVGTLFAAVYTVTTALFMPASGMTSGPFVTRLLRFWLGWLPMMGMAYAAVFAMASATHASRRQREVERQAAALAVQLAESRLQALQSQLHPHFLFNTLNAIVVLVREKETDAAARMLVLLSDILRQLLHHGATQEVPLRDEVALLSRYLEIQQLRFEDRLRVEWDVDADVLDASVPHLVLQPLVENAIRHGVGARSAPGVLCIRARRHGDALELRVLDNGVGLPPGFDLERGQGIGLSNTRARLSQLYGDAGHLRVASADGTGTEATVLLPWHSGPRPVGAVHG
ncbi:sensor histidine kinase [Corallococcus llansteffanensis]|uniref:histidine kinase n=1 Tax=Corallococcus llansteffanensis TaxID=2316731 RepID=A0A3A8PQ53_9BACT|nr:sensor histidine kinase [Corallococcus llansteffanensis]